MFCLEFLRVRYWAIDFAIFTLAMSFYTDLLLTYNTNNTTAKVEYFNIKSSTEGKILSIKFDFKLSFENHISSVCTKASQKLHALTLIVNYMDRFGQIWTVDV